MRPKCKTNKEPPTKNKMTPKTRRCAQAVWDPVQDTTAHTQPDGKAGEKLLSGLQKIAIVFVQISIFETFLVERFSRANVPHLPRGRELDVKRSGTKTRPTSTEGAISFFWGGFCDILTNLQFSLHFNLVLRWLLKKYGYLMVLHTSQFIRDHSVNIVDNISPKFHKYDSFSTQLRITNCHLALSTKYLRLEFMHLKWGAVKHIGQRLQLYLSHCILSHYIICLAWIVSLIMQFVENFILHLRNTSQRVSNGFLGQVLRERQGGLGRKQTHCHLQLSKVSTLKASTTGQSGLNFVHEI